MKTITDIKENVELLHTMDRHARMETEKKYKKKIFELYKDVPELMNLVNNLENFKTGEYSIDHDGDLIYGIEVSKDISSLPEIGSWLEGFFGNYKDGTYYQWCGDFISVNWSGRDCCYFVYDHGTQKAIIEERPKDKEKSDVENYVRAKVELYMRKRGQYDDVIETDYYGGYVQHFELRFPDRSENLDEVTNEELQTIIDNFEQENDDEL